MTHISLTVGACRGHGVFSEHVLLLNDHYALASHLSSTRHGDTYASIFYFFVLMTYILPLGLGLDWGLVSNVPNTLAALISRIHSLVRQRRI